MERITLEDVTNIKCVSEVQVSPDGRYAAYVVTSQNKEKNTYINDIFCTDLKSGDVRQLTHDGNSSGFIFDSNDTLLFAAERSEDDKPEKFREKTSFYRLPLFGGEAKKCFELPYTAVQIIKIENGKYAVKILLDWNRLDPDKNSAEACEEEEDYHIFEEVPFWGNGRGYISGKRTALFLYEEKDGTLLRITDKKTNVSMVTAKNGYIAYVSRTYDDIIPNVSSLTLYDIQKKKKKVIVKQNKFRVDMAALTDSGLVYTASDMKTWGNGQLSDIYRYDFVTGKSELAMQNSEEFAIGDAPLTDTFYGGGIVFKAVKDKVYFTAMQKAESAVYVLTKKNQVKKVVDFKGAVACFDISGKDVVFAASEENNLNALYKYSKEGIEVLHEPNSEFLKDKYVAKAEYLPFTDRDGVEIDGWVLKPFDYDETKKYPGVLEIHGGPRCAYSTVFFHEMQAIASKGYFVFFCNPRGSESYGEEFADLRGKYGTIDFHDLMDFTDVVLETYPQIDPSRIGCAGGSYGGFMCNWIEGNTDRFAAIASQRSVSNWVADFGASEIGVSFDSNEMAATPWTDMEKMWDQSPLKYACNGKTPILFIHSLCDYNCPLDQGLEMFTAMKYFKVPSKMVVFEGENHSLSRSGKPKHRIRRLKEICAWFEKYLKD